MYNETNVTKNHKFAVIQLLESFVDSVLVVLRDWSCDISCEQPRRTVLGNMDVVLNFRREEILEFYHRWYRPDLQAIIIAGDFDVDDMEARVRRTFSSIPAAVAPEMRIMIIPRLSRRFLRVKSDVLQGVWRQVRDWSPYTTKSRLWLAFR